MCERMPVCGCAEMCGNRETRTIPAFASVSTVRKLCGNCAEIVRKTLSACTHTREMLSPCAQGAENAFPAFSERMTPSGTLYSRLVPDGPFCSSTETG